MFFFYAAYYSNPYTCRFITSIMFVGRISSDFQFSFDILHWKCKNPKTVKCHKQEKIDKSTFKMPDYILKLNLVNLNLLNFSMK